LVCRMDARTASETPIRLLGTLDGVDMRRVYQRRHQPLCYSQPDIESSMNVILAL
jgi:hypothetical protein